MIRCLQFHELYSIWPLYDEVAGGFPSCAWTREIQTKLKPEKLIFCFTREASFSGRKLVMDSPWNLFCVQFVASGGLPQIMAELNIKEPYMVLEVSICTHKCINKGVWAKGANRKRTFRILGQWFCPCLGEIVSIRVKTLCNYYYKWCCVKADLGRKSIASGKSPSLKRKVAYFA